MKKFEYAEIYIGYGGNTSVSFKLYGPDGSEGFSLGEFGFGISADNDEKILKKIFPEIAQKYFKEKLKKHISPSDIRSQMIYYLGINGWEIATDNNYIGLWVDGLNTEHRYSAESIFFKRVIND